MRAWLSLSLDELRATTPDRIAEQLTVAQTRRFAGTELAQLDAWQIQASLLKRGFRDLPFEARLLLEYDLLRLEKRIDAVLVTDRALFVLEFKIGAEAFAADDLRQVVDYALDLHDFHAASRSLPIFPVLIATKAPDCASQPGLALDDVASAITCNGDNFGELIASCYRNIQMPRSLIDIAAWQHAPYRPIPTVLEAATKLYRNHSVADIAETRADAANLNITSDAIAEAISRAQQEHSHVVIFVTGIPGAGKTLCGLNVVFGALRDHGAAFLSGNTPLVKVLREALAQDAAPSGGVKRGIARRKAATALQNVHKFLEHHVVRADEIPEARIIVFDEAQRAWDAAQATRDTQRRVSQLTASEPAHTLEIMGRFQDWSVIIALIGNGQEINTGEAGLAEWGAVISANPRWSAVAAQRAINSSDPAQRLAAGPKDWLQFDERLDLTVPMRSVRDQAGAQWVEAVIDGDQAGAASIAKNAGGIGFFVTRDLAEARSAIRRLSPGFRRGGLVATAGAGRLRAEGLGVQLEEVEHWFLNRWPDIRASEALEQYATEYDCQRLELDVVGLAWDGDLLRVERGWQTRSLSGAKWQIVRSAENHRFILNSYRVLLTRARYETIIWVPRGSPAGDPFHDVTRPSAQMDRIAEYLLGCGAGELNPTPTP